MCLEVGELSEKGMKWQDSIMLGLTGERSNGFIAGVMGNC